jgi:hypothetical protein
MRLSAAALRQRQTKLIYLNHRLPPWLRVHHAILAILPSRSLRVPAFGRSDEITHLVGESSVLTLSSALIASVITLIFRARTDCWESLGRLGWRALGHLHLTLYYATFGVVPNTIFEKSRAIVVRERLNGNVRGTAVGKMTRDAPRVYRVKHLRQDSWQNRESTKASYDPRYFPETGYHRDAS